MNKYLLATWVCLGDDSEVPEDVASTLLSRAEGLNRYGPVAAYRLTGGGETMAELGRRVARLDADATLRGSHYVVVVQLDGVLPALGEDGARRRAREDVLQGLPVVSSLQALYLTSETTEGPEPLDEPFGNAIQFGTFSMKDPEDDWLLAEWYEFERLPAITKMQGAQRARRLYSVAGQPKFGIFYEFASLEAREEHFERPHEKYALDTGHLTGRTVERTVHMPQSPSVGERVLLA